MYQFAELIAVMASASYGALLARQHKMDLVGVFAVSFIVAFGGGTLRDLFLDRHPLFWIKSDHYPVIVFCISLLLSLTRNIPRWLERVLPLADAMGLGLFSLVGAAAALESGTSMFVAALMGVVTGTFGGVIGDVICNKVPSLFTPAPLYASVSFVGCWLMFGMQYFNLLPELVIVLTVFFIVMFRLLAIKLNLCLPGYSEEKLQ